MAEGFLDRLTFGDYFDLSPGNTALPNDFQSFIFGAMGWKRMSMSDAYSVVAESVGLKPKDVKAAVEGIMTLAAKQMKKSGKFNLAHMITLKLKNRPATKAYRGVNPFAKNHCVFKVKRASKTVNAIPLIKLKEIANDIYRL